MSASPVSTIVSIGGLVFCCIWVAAMFCWIQVVKHRRAGLRWWNPIWSSRDIQPEGQPYFRRYLILMVAGFVTVLVVIALEAAVRAP